MREMNSDSLVRIDPIGYATRKGTGRITVWSYKRFSPKLTAKVYERICIEKNAFMVDVIELPDKSIVHQYPNKPKIVINSEDGRLYTTRKDLEKYGRIACEHQATFPMRLLFYGHTEFIEGVSKREMSLAEFRFLQSRVEINDTVIKDDLKITLLDAGIYQYRNSNVLGFTIGIENMMDNATVMLRLDMMKVSDDMGYSYEVDTHGLEKVTPNSKSETYFYASRFKKDTKITIMGACTTSDLKKIDFKFELHSRQLTKDSVA